MLISRLDPLDDRQIPSLFCCWAVILCTIEANVTITATPALSFAFFRAVFPIFFKEKETVGNWGSSKDGVAAHMVGMKCTDTGGTLRIIGTDFEPLLWPHMKVGDDIVVGH
jgi:hypothetical protein